MASWLNADPARCWSIDYRFRVFASSDTSHEWGTQPPPPIGWSPRVRENYSINSCWDGLYGEIHRPTWDVHFEWMMSQQGIQGDLAQRQWNPPNPNGSYTDLGFSTERWSGSYGQMIDIGGERQLWDHLFRYPIEVWPMAGFRWQRFPLTGYDWTQVKLQNKWVDDFYPGDVLTFNQQYYIGYIGGQLRTRVAMVALTFQGDWGYTWGYNVENNTFIPGDDYTIDNTQGSSWHLGFTAEVFLNNQFSLGFQVDHVEIRTYGTHQEINYPKGTDAAWSNGVFVSSDQTSITAFLRCRF
jgi:hypothetical protein